MGLADEKGLQRFNPPSLRGVSQREPYLHDGSAATLRDVFLARQHPRGAVYTAEEVSELVAYLARL